jgi:MoaA/NifB/PqqE/SkfB family radical SAM enzyme
MFKKIYIEITNSCNFHCSFCFSTTQPTRFISVKNFQTIVEKIKPYTNYIYLHVLGEPLLHPQLEEILNVAEREGIECQYHNKRFIAESSERTNTKPSHSPTEYIAT